MPKGKQQKQEDLKELTEKLKTAKGVVFSDYRGTTVKDLDKFRKSLSKEGVFSKVYKLTLVKKALEQLAISGEVDYKTPVIMSVSSDDETVAARLIKNLAKDVKTITILQGILDGKMVEGAAVLALADLPSKDQLRGQLVGTINAPVSGFVRVLAGNIRGLMNVLNAVASK